jgi:transcriptional antiterminator NusG
MAKHWYVVHTYSGYENKVKSDLEHRIETFGMEDMIVDIQIPTEQVTQVKEGGKRETKDAKIFPGYVLVRMEVTDDSWAVVRNTPGVTGFVGIEGKPTPLSRDEFNKIMRRSSVGGTNVPKRTATDFEVGQSVRVVSGPLADFDGQISDIMPDAGKVKVMLLIFGRETPVELSLDQIETIK